MRSPETGKGSSERIAVLRSERGEEVGGLRLEAEGEVTNNK